ncbi:hypothetical protein ACFLWI_00060 [Chloroflexota bacterium]
MINIPKDVQKYLVNEEIVERKFTFKGISVYASNNRMFIKTGRSVRDVSYAHIPTIEHKSKRSLWVSLFGVFAGIAGFIWQTSNVLGWALIVAGIALMILGFVWKLYWVEITITGVNAPIPLYGKQDECGAISRFVGERRVVTR